MNKIITIWERKEKNKDGIFVWNHNHISDGYDPHIKKPIPKSKNQQGWKGFEWKSTKGILINNKVFIYNERYTIQCYSCKKIISRSKEFKDVRYDVCPECKLDCHNLSDSAKIMADMIDSEVLNKILDEVEKSELCLNLE